MPPTTPVAFILGSSGAGCEMLEAAGPIVGRQKGRPFRGLWWRCPRVWFPVPQRHALLIRALREGTLTGVRVQGHPWWWPSVWWSRLCRRPALVLSRSLPCRSFFCSVTPRAELLCPAASASALQNSAGSGTSSRRHGTTKPKAQRFLCRGGL